MPRPSSRAWDGMTRPLRVGVIGANPNRSWAKDSHIPALRSLENVQLAAVATTSRANADAAAAAFGVRAAYDDPRTPHDAVSVIGCNTATRPPRRVMMWANTASTAEPPSRAWPSRDRAPLSGCRRGGRYSTGYDIQRVDRGARRAHGCLDRRTSSGWKV